MQTPRSLPLFHLGEFRAAEASKPNDLGQRIDEWLLQYNASAATRMPKPPKAAAQEVSNGAGSSRGREKAATNQAMDDWVALMLNAGAAAHSSSLRDNTAAATARGKPGHDMSRVRHAFTASHPLEPSDRAVLRQWFARMEAYREELQGSWTALSDELDATLITRSRTRRPFRREDFDVLTAATPSRRRLMATQGADGATARARHRRDPLLWERLAHEQLRHQRTDTGGGDEQRLTATTPVAALSSSQHAAAASSRKATGKGGGLVVPTTQQDAAAATTAANTCSALLPPKRPLTARPISDTCRFPRF